MRCPPFPTLPDNPSLSLDTVQHAIFLLRQSSGLSPPLNIQGQRYPRLCYSASVIPIVIFIVLPVVTNLWWGYHQGARLLCQKMRKIRIKRKPLEAIRWVIPMNRSLKMNPLHYLLNRSFAVSPKMCFKLFCNRKALYTPGRSFMTYLSCEAA